MGKMAKPSEFRFWDWSHLQSSFPLKLAGSYGTQPKIGISACTQPHNEPLILNFILRDSMPSVNHRVQLQETRSKKAFHLDGFILKKACFGPTSTGTNRNRTINTFGNKQFQADTLTELSAE
jgi:hypothetical protein